MDGINDGSTLGTIDEMMVGTFVGVNEGDSEGLTVGISVG
jgi:hypothetical protein